MNQKLKALSVAISTLVLAGVGFQAFITKGPDTSLADLRDAGIAEGQRFVLVCPERITPKTRNRLLNRQPGALRPRQRYASVARVAVCFNPDGGNCFTQATGAVRVASGTSDILIPSLRTLASQDDGGVDGTGEDTSVDDSLQFEPTRCKAYTCSQADAMTDAGTLLNPYADRFCGGLNRLAVQPPDCAIPNGFRADGGWSEGAPVDCKFKGPYALPDGGARWIGFNAAPRVHAVGTQCLPVQCSVLLGDREGDL